ncbi:ABC transporter ATP-binding protein [Roseateles cavernae]|uniref:ABC transporter ATP-binding protein n=1 Tax=Roseateles cavernae TaxID=3153578 RepID=UPI0032E41B9E
MAGLSFKGVAKRYGDKAPVVRALDLEVQDGEFMVLVGPSGCGKSTSLRMLAGLEEVSAGQIFIGAREVTTVPPAERGVAMVFQSYALYPHMSVAENMGFALKMAGRPKAEVAAAVLKAARSLQLEALLGRKPRELSGGQRQRVAIGRAIVRQPEVFLFDEPLSNLDAALRHETRLELARLHEELGATIVYVTHDQVEAMTLGDRIAVFNEGRIEQVGAPMEVYERPVNRFVAAFLGSPRINFLPAGLIHTALPAGTETVGLRPEHLKLVAAGTGLDGELALIEHLGDTSIAYVRIAGVEQALAVKLVAGQDWQRHQRVGLQWRPEHLLAFDAQGLRLEPRA